VSNPIRGDSPDAVKSVGSKTAPAATRFLFAGYVALALASVVLSWKRAPGSLLGVAVAVIILSTLVALLMRALAGSATLAARSLLWAVLSCAIVLAALFISSAFFGTPERGAVIVARLLNESAIAVVDQSTPALVVGPNDPQLWPSSAKGPLSVSGDRFERVNALSRRPSVTIDGATIISDTSVVSVNVLTLNGGIIVTGGGNLTIEAVRIVSNGGVIRSFEGQPVLGRSGGRVVLKVHERIDGQLSVDLSGGPGSAGEKGRAGARGRDGGPGENSAQNLFGCSHGGGTGGAGQPGGIGGDGGAGLPGGNGGTLVLQGPDADLLARSVVFAAKGGVGGVGGLGGDGGPGGNGGPGGHGGGYCGGGQAGPNGPPGPSGKAGPNGKPGDDGPPPVRTQLGMVD
jgi:hypothetical protein